MGETYADLKRDPTAKTEIVEKDHLKLFG